MRQYLADRRGWDWNQPLSLKQAKTYLWSLDRCDIYNHSNNDNDASSNNLDMDSIHSEGEDVLYLQAPNVPKVQVRYCLGKRKLQFLAETKARESPERKQQEKQIMQASSTSLSANAPQSKNPSTGSTLSTTVTGTLKGFQDFIGNRGELSPLSGHVNIISDPNPSDNNHSNSELSLLATKKQETLKLRQELHDCQEQLSRLAGMVKQLKEDAEIRNQETLVVAAPLATVTTAMRHPNVEMPQEHQIKNAKDCDYEDEEEEEEWFIEVGGSEQNDTYKERDEWIVV
jgi:hypothetical protein